MMLPLVVPWARQSDGVLEYFFNARVTVLDVNGRFQFWVHWTEQFRLLMRPV